MEKGCGGTAGRGIALCLVAVAQFAVAACADVGSVGVAPEESFSIPAADVGRRIPAVAGAPLPPGAVAGTARVGRQHALRLIGARVRNTEIVRGGEVLGSFGHPGRRIPMSASAVPPSSPSLPRAMPTPGPPAGTARDGDGEGCWYLVYYWLDNGEIFHVTLLSCGGGSGSEDEPECTDDQKAIAAEYDNDGEWPCDKFDDTPVFGKGTHGHATGYLTDSYISGSGVVLARVATRGVSGATITSDWRCPEGNALVGGTGQTHVQGRAGDFWAPGFLEHASGAGATPEEVAAASKLHAKFAAAAIAAGGRFTSFGHNGTHKDHIHIFW
ncbi:MAG: hypothetical protein OXR82_13940 [Gammaproteobacteria bacterium]|nr:hypothetical protein [Gammaproteobacteria bacterium]